MKHFVVVEIKCREKTCWRCRHKLDWWPMACALCRDGEGEPEKLETDRHGATHRCQQCLDAEL